jgi:HAD superfamily hydrolase (TIGR01490 family)
VAGAAFFDLDRTLIRRSSALALAGSFRERGMISRRQMAHAAYWQMLFVARGADEQAIRGVAERGLHILHGYRPGELQELVAGAMENVLKPLVYAEPLELVEQHRERGERVYIVSAALQEIVDEIAAELDFDGALGTICEVEDGHYTGRALRVLHGAEKADAVRDLARREGIDLDASTAYSDSDSDRPFLEAVGRPIAVNPDRALRVTAAEQGWPVLEFGRRGYPHARRRRIPAALVVGVPLLVGAVVALRSRAG